jgi:hypothetical protein
MIATAKYISRYFSKEEIQIIKNYIKRFSPSPVREIQVKTTMSYQVISHKDDYYQKSIK